MSDDVLLADIGGTHARFALAATAAATPLRMDSVRQFEVAAFASLHEAAAHYLRDLGAAPRCGVFAVAGRIDGDEARITNHPWVISRRRTAAALALDTLALVNDFAAQAQAVPLLGPEHVIAIGGPTAAPGGDAVAAGTAGGGPAPDRTYAVIGPGTGLGVGALLRRGGAVFDLPGEGGHVGFAPGTPEEVAILDQLGGEFGRVSVERLVSGSGLVNLHRALSRLAGEDPGPLAPRDVSERAAAGDPRCRRALDVFCAVFGAIAGDLVLTLGAWDGVYLTGGLVPRLLPELQRSGFRQRFEHKGRFSAAMARVPTLAVIHPQPGLLGAAAIARAGARG